jgi:hypothetical protein
MRFIQSHVVVTPIWDMPLVLCQWVMISTLISNVLELTARGGLNANDIGEVAFNLVPAQQVACAVQVWKDSILDTGMAGRDALCHIAVEFLVIIMTVTTDPETFSVRCLIGLT